MEFEKNVIEILDDDDDNEEGKKSSSNFDAKIKIELKQPFKLFPYQEDAIKWMKERENDNLFGIRGGILCMKMGMGKTLTTLTHILSCPKGDFPTLVVTSRTVLDEWRHEGIEKFFKADQVKVLYFHKDFLGKKKFQNINRREILEYDIVLTTYDICSHACRKSKFYTECQELDKLGRIAQVHLRAKHLCDLPNLVGTGILFGTPWHRIVCDESQKFANYSTFLFKSLMAIYADYRWCLSGTPIRNYDTDIWAQFRFCGYNGLKKPGEWKKSGEEHYKTYRLDQVICAMDYFDAGIELVEKHDHIHLIELEEKSMKVYQYILTKTREMYDKMLSKLVDYVCVFALFTRLRQTSIAPYLLTKGSKRYITLSKKSKKIDSDDDDDNDEQEAYFSSMNLLEGMENYLGKWCHLRDLEAGVGSEKIKKAIEIITQIVPDGEKVVVFSNFSSCLDLLLYALKCHFASNSNLEDIFKVVQIDGSIEGEERVEAFKKFKTDPRVKCLLLSYKTGSEGVNLTHANHCILMEPWWCNAVHLQAISRIWRTGQVKPIHVHQLIAANTIEQKILEMCLKKEEISTKFLSGKQTSSTSEKKKQPRSLLGKEMMRQILGL